jgi:hypothetical protein
MACSANRVFASVQINGGLICISAAAHAARERAYPTGIWMQAVGYLRRESVATVGMAGFEPAASCSQSRSDGSPGIAW